MSVKKTVKVLGAKVKVTKKDARDSDNWFILAFGAFLGFVLGLMI